MGAGGNALGFEGLGIGADSSVAFPNNEWHHIAVTYDYSTVRFYVDGVLRNSQSKSGQNVDTSDTVLIGAVDPGFANWSGIADEIRVSNRVINDFSYVMMPGQDPQIALGSTENQSPTPIPTITPVPTHTLTPIFTNTSLVPPTSTLTPTSTPVPQNNLTVGSGQVFYSDDIRSALAGSASSGQNNLLVVNGSGFIAGQEILIFQVKGTGAGSYEFAQILNVNGNTINLQGSLAKSYYVDASSRAQVIQVLHYDNITVDSGEILTAHNWDGNTGGVMIIRSLGSTIIRGSVIMTGGNGTVSRNDQQGAGSGGGFRGGNNSADGSGAWAGEGITGTYGTETTSNQSNGGGGAGGYDYGLNDGAGGGNGGIGGNGSAGYPSVVRGGNAVGDPSLASIFFGGGGGGGRCDTGGNGGAAGGGSGGGIVMIYSADINILGSINVNGGTGGTGCANGGGGAGGSILIRAMSVNLGTQVVTAYSGTGPGNAGEGGTGRIRVEYGTYYSGSTNPDASIYQDLDLLPTPTPTATFTPTPTYTPIFTPTNTTTTTPSNTATATHTPTFTPTGTPTSTPGVTPTDTSIATPVPTSTPTGTPICPPPATLTPLATPIWNIVCNSPSYGIMALQAYSGRLYAAGIGTYQRNGRLYQFDGTSWTDTNFHTQAGGRVDFVQSLQVFDNKLFIGTRVNVGGADLARVYSYDGTNFVLELSRTGQEGYSGIEDLAVHDNTLYAANGSRISEVYRRISEGNWVTVGSPIEPGSPARALASYNGELYAGTGTYGNNPKVWKWTGSAWILAVDLRSNFGISQDGVLGLAVSDGRLYVGVTGQSSTNPIFVYDGTTWSKSLEVTGCNTSYFSLVDTSIWAGMSCPVQAYQLVDGNWIERGASNDLAMLRFASYGGDIYAGTVGDGLILSLDHTQVVQTSTPTNTPMVTPTDTATSTPIAADSCGRG